MNLNRRQKNQPGLRKFGYLNEMTTVTATGNEPESKPQASSSSLRTPADSVRLLFWSLSNCDIHVAVHRDGPRSRDLDTAVARALAAASDTARADSRLEVQA